MSSIRSKPKIFVSYFSGHLQVIPCRAHKRGVRFIQVNRGSEHKAVKYDMSIKSYIYLDRYRT